MTSPKLAAEPVDLYADLVVPAAPPEALSSWCRMVLAIDTAKSGAYALTGRELHAGTAYRLPSGALVVSCDKHAGHRKITLWRAETGGLAEVHTWSQKAPLGARIVTYIARRLPTISPAALATFKALEDLPNRWEARCTLCRQTVPAGEGRLVHESGKSVVAHRGPCPARPPLRNQWAGKCGMCGGWIEEGAGIVVPHPDYVAAGIAPLIVRHPDTCPAVPEPAPITVNTRPDWCTDCGEMVAVGAGRHVPGDGTRHEWPCPEMKVMVPMWRVFRPEWALQPEAGQVAWTRISPREGESEVPFDAPGFRVLAEDLVQAVTVVIDWRPARGGFLARVRVATTAEAEGLVARRLALALDAVPDARGHKADYKLERFGAQYGSIGWAGNPWVAEITGRQRRFGGYEREFLRPKLDYSNANSKGTRGVWCHWTLSVNKVYEAHCLESWRQAHRAFLRVTPDGDVREISKAEVEAWLDWSAPLLYSLGADEDEGEGKDK